MAKYRIRPIFNGSFDVQRQEKSLERGSLYYWKDVARFYSAKEAESWIDVAIQLEEIEKNKKIKMDEFHNNNPPYEYP